MGYLDVTNNIAFGTTFISGINDSAVLLSYSDTNQTVGLISTRPSSVFLIQDNALGTPVNKLQLDGSNYLSLYGTNGSAGILLNPNSGGITLAGTGAGLTLSDGTVLSNSNSLHSSALYDANGNAQVSFGTNGNLNIGAPISLTGSGATLGITFSSGNSLNSQNVAFLNQALQNLGYRQTSNPPAYASSIPSNFTITQVVADAAGNSYLTGTFSDSVQIGGRTLTSAGATDIFIAKVNGTGAVLWAKSYGGADTDVATGIAVDGNGNVYVTGYFYGSDLESYILKYNGYGAFQWKFNVGTTGIACAAGIGVDGSGNAYITGFLNGTITNAPGSATSVGEPETFVMKINANGAPQWAIDFAGDYNNSPTGIAVDASGNSYVTGEKMGSFLNVSNYDNRRSVFLVKVNGSGAVQWKQLFSENNFAVPGGVVVDGSGNSYITGGLCGSLGIYNQTNNSYTDLVSTPTQAVGGVYLVKVNNSGAVQWGRLYGGNSGGNSVSGISVSNGGNIYLIGNFTDPVSNGLPRTLTSNGQNDIFVIKVNGSGVAQWGAGFGGAGSDTASGIAVDGTGALIIAGYAPSNFAMGNQVMTAGSFIYRGPENALVSTVLSSTAGFSWGGSIASSDGAVAAGVHAVASSEGAVALGGGESSGGYSFSSGIATKSDGYGSVAFGVSNSATGQSAMAFGTGDIASGNSSTAFGSSSTASGDYSTAIGNGTKAQSFSSFSLGQYNVGLVTSSNTPIYNGDGDAIGSYNGSTGWVASDAVVEIGNGTSGFPSNAVTIFKSGELRTQGLIQSQAGVRVPPTGDLSMGGYTNGANPATLNPATGLLYPSGN